MDYLQLLATYEYSVLPDKLKLAIAMREFDPKNSGMSAKDIENMLLDVMNEHKSKRLIKRLMITQEINPTYSGEKLYFTLSEKLRSEIDEKLKYLSHTLGYFPRPKS